MKKHRVLDIILLILKIILPILIAIPLVFVSYRLIEGRIEDLKNIGNESYHSGLGLYIFASHVLLLAANAILFVLGGAGLIIAIQYKSCPKRRKNIKAFICLTAAPILSQWLYLLINIIVVNVG